MLNKKAAELGEREREKKKEPHLTTSRTFKGLTKSITKRQQHAQREIRGLAMLALCSGHKKCQLCKVSRAAPSGGTKQLADNSFSDLIAQSAPGLKTAV